MTGTENPVIRQKAVRYLLMAWIAYVVFVLVSGWGSFGLTAQPEHGMKWAAVRLATVTFWLLCSAVLLWFRKPPADWNSFFAAALTTALTAVIALPSLAPEGSNYLATGGSVCFYSLVSGFLCITVRKISIAAIFGLFLFPAQLSVDAAAHLFSGVFRLH